MSVLDKINIDFQVLDTNDPRVILIADNSIWGHIEDKPTIIEITVAGESSPKVHYFKQKQLNSINSYHLGLSCPNECGEMEFTDIPDGIYTITVKGSPDKYFKTRKYLRTVLTRLELDKLYINLNLFCKEKNMDLYNLLIDIDLMLKSAEANVRHDNIAKAQELFFKAQALIQKAKGCKSCVNV